jgi:phage terminase large subunit
MDFGFTNDPTTLVEVWKEADNLYLNEILYDQGLTNSDIAEKLREAGVDRYIEIIADSAVTKSITE